MAYEFVEIGEASAPSQPLTPDEGFTFNGFNSMEQWWLTERSAPSPDEQKITEQVPYSQGELDFSMLGGERFFDMREITYKLLLYDRDYNHRKGYEQELKRELMQYGFNRLQDTHDSAYYWWAKCMSVEVDDSSEDYSVEATVKFKAYPFAYTNHDEGADYWDDVVFTHWIWQDVKFTVNGDRAVTVQNIGSRPVLSSFVVSGSVMVKIGSTSLALTGDNYQGKEIVMEMGTNTFNLSGNGTIEFKFKREELI
ncbi:phage tail protein [Limosilactobacillus fermentum]